MVYRGPPVARLCEFKRLGSEPPRKRADWTVHLVVGMDDLGTLWALDLWRKQASPEVSATAMLDLYEKWQPTWFGPRKTPIVEKGIGPLVLRMSHERKALRHEQAGF